MDLTINFVWIGPKALGWLELFMIYAWRMWNCEVILYTHSGPGLTDHDHESLGLPPGVCRIIDLPKIIAQDEDSDGMGMDDVEQAKPIRNVLTKWYGNRIQAWGEGGQEQIFNMVDLTKSYIASTRQGVVLDMKIGPSAHLKKYVDKKVFENHFVSYQRAGTIENQCMGSMMLDSSARMEYCRLFLKRTILRPTEQEAYIGKPCDVWFGDITSGHINGCSFSKRLTKFLDIGVCGAAAHEQKYLLANAKVAGVAGEEFYGPLRIFKKESDQTNKSSSERTTPQEQVEMQNLTFREIAAASSRGDVDVTAQGMPPVIAMLDLLSKTKPPR